VSSQALIIGGSSCDIELIQDKRSICDLEYDFAPPTFPETGVARMYRELLAYALSEGVEGVCPRQVGFCLGATRSIDAEAIVLTVPWKTIDSRPSKPPNSPPSHASEPDFPSYPSWPKSFRDVPYPDLPSVSLLTPFTPISDPLAWTPSTHGIHLTFPHPTEPHRTLSATYLPEVCPEQGWSREETVLSAIQKAGWAGRVEVGDAVWRSLRVKVYGSVKAGTGYRAYIGWRKGGEGTRGMAV